MENRNNDHMIYLKDLIFTALYQWKKLLIGAIALAVLLGGFQGIAGLIDLTDPKTLESITKQNKIQLERYEAEVKSLDMQIETLRGQIRSQQEYLDNSLLMQLEPYAYFEASLVVYVQTDYHIMPGMTYQTPDKAPDIIRAYEALLLGNDCLQAMADAMGTEPRYLKELLVLNQTANTQQTTVQSESNVLSVVAKAPTQEQAQQLLELLLEQVMLQQQSISASVGTHQLTVVEQATRSAIDLKLAETQQAENDRLTALLTAQTTAQTSQATLSKPTLQADGGKAVLKKAIIFTVIGGVLAVFLGVVILWIGHISSDKVYSARTLSDRTGVKILGTSASQIPAAAIDRKLRKLEGRDLADASAKAQLLALNIRKLAEGASTVLLTGTACAQDRQALVAELSQAMPQVKFLNADDVLSDVAALEALTACDVVVLTEQCGISLYSDVIRRIDLIRDYNKQLLGCVLYGG